MGVVRRDVGIVLRDFIEGSFPEIEGEGQDVGFAAQGQFLSLVSFSGDVEGEADAALHTLACIDGFLDGHFIGGSPFKDAARAGIEPFGVFPDDHEIDFLRSLVFQRRIDAFIKFHGAQIDVLIQFKAGPQQDALFEDARCYFGMTDRAEKDGLMLFQFPDHAVRKGFACPLVAFPAQVVGGIFQAEAVSTGRGIEHFDAFRNDFRPCSVTGNHTDMKFCPHGILLHFFLNSLIGLPSDVKEILS